MVQRSDEKQTEHDKVIEYLESVYENQYPKVYTNPNGKKNFSIEGYEGICPDILVANEENFLTFIEEVETSDTVSEDHAKEQWVPYFKLRTTFHIRVPLGSQEKAREILAKLKINATVKCYSITQDDKVTIMDC